MRELRFRAKRKENGKWVEGAVLQTEDGKCYIATSYLVTGKDKPIMIVVEEADTKTLCQYTGRLDERGKKIFEGDIVCFMDSYSTEHGYSEQSCLGEVVWDEEECCFHVTNRLSSESWEVLDACNVVGNVFDNKELMDECER